MIHPKTCIVIVGPTAVGKTGLAVQLAKSLQTSIISADSRQCYRELNIGVAKPSPAQLSEVNHYFINSHAISEEVHAGLFEQYALTKLEEVFSKSDHAILVGGTGLYVDAFCNGMDQIPAIAPEIRKEVVSSFQEKGIGWLQDQVRILDPGFFESGEMLNPQRLMRALEVILSTGNSIKYYHTSKKKQRNFSIIKIGLELPKSILYNQINARVDKMVKDGLLDEVNSLVPFRHLNALNTVGYKELFAFLNGTATFTEAIEMIKQNTRHYAKRQMTWFKKDHSVCWVHPDDHSRVIAYAGDKGIYLPPWSNSQ